jgi:hypothetical protein
MLVEINRRDAFGSVALPEFLRLAGLVAAGHLDAWTLAHELARTDATLHLEPAEMRDTDAHSWYSQVRDGYQAWQAARDARGRDTVEYLEAKSIAEYEHALNDAAHALLVVAEEAQVEVVHVPAAVPLAATPVR